MRKLSLRLLLLAVAALPRRLRKLAVTALSRIRYRIYRQACQPLVSSIQRQLGCSVQQAEAVLRRSFDLHLLGILDGIRLVLRGRAAVAAAIEFRGLDRLTEAAAGGRGAVATIAHSESMFMLLVALAHHELAPNFIRIPPERRGEGRLARVVSHRIDRRFERAGCRSVYMGTGSTKPEALDALRRGELVISPIDLSQSRDNAVVDFFGCPATFPRGLAALAKANHAPLIDLFIYRADGDGLVVEVGEPFIVNDIDAAVQHSASRLEEQIRRHPADWPAWHMFDVWDARDRRSGLASLQHNEPVHVFG